MCRCVCVYVLALVREGASVRRFLCVYMCVCVRGRVKQRMS